MENVNWEEVNRRLISAQKAAAILHPLRGLAGLLFLFPALSKISDIDIFSAAEGNY